MFILMNTNINKSNIENYLSVVTAVKNECSDLLLIGDYENSDLYLYELLRDLETALKLKFNNIKSELPLDTDEKENILSLKF